MDETVYVGFYINLKLIIVFFYVNISNKLDGAQRRNVHARIDTST